MRVRIPHSQCTSRRRGVVAALVVLPMVAVAAGCSAQAAGSSDTVKVGIIWPFDGAYSNYGPDGMAGAELALKQAGMKVAGKKIELVKANEDVLDPSKTLSETKRLVQQEGVKVLVGPVFGSSQQAVAPYLKTNDVMSFVPYGTTKELGGTGNFISWPGLDTSYSTPLGDFLTKHLHAKTIATVGADYVFGRNVLKGATASFKKAGGKVLQQQWVPLGTTDVLPYAAHLNRKADALVMWLVPQDEASFIKGFRSLNINMPIVFVYGMFDPTFQSAASQIKGSYGIVAWSAGFDNAANKAFVSAFKKANKGHVPNSNNVAAYVDTKLALATLKGTGGSTSFGDLTTSVKSVKLKTPYGPAQIDDNYFGKTTRTIVRATKKDGRYWWSPVKTYSNIPNEQ